MDMKEIQDLIKLINKSNIGELKIQQGEFKITIRQKEEKVVSVSALPQAVPMMSALPAAPSSVPPAVDTAAKPASKPIKEDNLVAIKSPMIGTFYRRSSPDKPLLVDVGDEVSIGKVVCIIEAMKLFNDIESEVSGRIVKILVQDAMPVEFDQPLFLVDPY
ncbi:MAG: acetyl-CoA carboxylase biotin carboxyl carrier protein [Bacteroidetes bacterium]|nr:acetyl-CoA carboxylase biotin carboxyl carrier protein [Bacteroidota bacterium]